MKAPSFWYKQNLSLEAICLSPFTLLYRLGRALHIALATPYHAKIPVICLGNIVVGGAGKTPSALALAQTLLQQNAKPVFVTRGYGGCARGVMRVDPSRHTAHDVGDEALLLARVAPTWVGRDRAATIQLAEQEGTHIILDDGLQNPSLRPDLSFLVIDGDVGLGNECLLPAGPLRETLEDALKRITALILIGKHDEQKITSRVRCPVLRADWKPCLPSAFSLTQKYFAFAGIGRPEKFYASCRKAGLTLAGAQDFPDHHFFTNPELAALQKQAAEQQSQLLTTEKDWVRLPEDLRKKITPFPVTLVFDDPEALVSLLKI